MSGNADTLKLLFPIDLGGALDDDLAIDGRGLDRAEARAVDLLREMFADVTSELLPAWERLCGLTPGSDDPVQRRVAQVVRMLRDLGDIKRPYLVLLAAEMGYTITLDDYVPFMAGWGRSGDRLYIEDAIYVWKASMSVSEVIYFRSGQSYAGERLQSFCAPEDLVRMLEDRKPAEIFINYALDYGAIMDENSDFIADEDGNFIMGE